MNVLNGIVSELRERRLWPVAAVLVVALFAIPVLLSKSAHSAPVSPVSPSGLPISARGPIASVSVNNQPAHSRLTGPTRDPFIQQRLPSTTNRASGAPTSTSTAGASGPLSATSALSALAQHGSGGSATSSSGSGTSTNSQSTSPLTGPPTTLPSATPHTPPAPAGLTATESYRVALAITNPSGGLDTIDPLERLSILPNNQQPMLVELGVLKGGRDVLFAVQPGTVLSGPGACIPGPIDCEILSLGVDQTEQLSIASGNSSVPVALFAVTAISVDHHPSIAAAQKARRVASAAGRNLLSQSSSSALSLFPYRASIGAVVDLRNLSAGGS